VALDDERHWYRYHHLFADLLYQRLYHTHADQQPLLHLRASEWYAHNGFTEQAIEHSVLAQDFVQAALHSLLRRLYSMGLPLISLQMIR